MNLVELLDRHRSLFYLQSWFVGEPFTRLLATNVPNSPPSGLARAGQVPTNARGLYRAVDLIACYVGCPDAPIWRSYLWTADTDSLGQRVFIGGTSQGKGLQIHRHLHITADFGRPSWT